MRLHIFADPGLMLPETADFDLGHSDDVHYTAYRQHKLPGPSARIYQALHILTRPVSLRLSAWFARRFNDRLAVDPQQIVSGLAHVQPEDHVLWLNPSQAVATWVDGLRPRCAGVALYFLDPVHRLGLRAAQVRGWAAWARVFSYSRPEAAALGVGFLAPHVPALPFDVLPVKDLDVVYVGSPSPRRLWWVGCLRWRLWRRGGRGHLRLASRNTRLPRWFPGTFSTRVAFADYALLCARSRGVLELHERDADGVTLRAMLAQAVRATHLCNVATTPQTCVIAPWRWQSLDRFLQQPHRPSEVAVPPGPGLGQWLQVNFMPPAPCRPDSPAQS